MSDRAALIFHVQFLWQNLYSNTKVFYLVTLTLGCYFVDTRSMVLNKHISFTMNFIEAKREYSWYIGIHLQQVLLPFPNLQWRKLYSVFHSCVCRSVSYTVNGFYKHHVTVVAEVVAVALELSTEELVLYPSYGMPAEAGKFSILKKNFEKKN